MSTQPYRAGSLATFVLLCACQSSPATHYFALTEIPPTTSPAASSSQLPIRVERITIPAELDRLELVRKSAPNQLQIAAFDRWAAPLDTMMRRVVTADLAARLPPGTIASVNEPAVGEERQHLYIDVQEFSADESGAVTLNAGWLLVTPNAASVRGAAQIRVDATDAAVRALPPAMSRALANLSDRIAAAMGT
jgi:uncharacterized lipoprotein YmbA